MRPPSQRQRDALGKYLVALKQKMWLGMWRIDVMWDGEIPPDSLATIEPVYGRKVANLRLCVDFFEREPEQQRSTLVHELLHCSLADVQELACQLRTNLGDQAMDAWMPGYRLAMEHAVEQLSVVLCHEADIPLPRLPKS